jgi:hypothetical protein
MGFPLSVQHRGSMNVRPLSLVFLIFTTISAIQLSCVATVDDQPNIVFEGTWKKFYKIENGSSIPAIYGNVVNEGLATAYDCKVTVTTYLGNNFVAESYGYAANGGDIAPQQKAYVEILFRTINSNDEYFTIKQDITWKKR